MCRYAPAELLPHKQIERLEKYTNDAFLVKF